LAGGTWTTGLGILARGVRPQFFVIGDDAWQLILIEHGRRRALLALGEFDDDAEASVSRLTTSLRQHVDIVIGDRNFLSRASSVTSQWHGTVHIQLDPSPVAPASQTYLQLDGDFRIGIGDFTLVVRSLPAGLWRQSATSEQSWIGHLHHGPITVAMASTLDALAQHADPASALVIAPEGDLAALRRYIPNAGVVTNTGMVPRGVIANTNGDAIPLVRIFRSDTAAFRVRDGRIELPGWTQQIGN
jgi:hypothetical protein